MNRRITTSCLNQEPKAYNSPIGAIFGSVIVFIFMGLWKGFLWGVGGGGIGYLVGAWLSRQWFLGRIQRKLYRYLPGAKLIIDKNTPESHHRRLL